MYRVDLDIAYDIVDAIIEGAKEHPGLMNTAVNRRLLPRARRELLALLREEPPELTEADYPLTWKSLRQRRAFFATDGFGGGIPTVRTHLLSQSYDVELKITSEGGIFQITNDTPYHRFVKGDDAQPMHINRWNQDAMIVTSYEDKLSNMLIETWFTVVDPLAGVPRS